MSSFECRNGHEIIPSVGHCEICGGGVYRMDGMTNAQLRAMEREDDLYDARCDAEDRRREREGDDEDEEGYTIDGEVVDE